MIVVTAYILYNMRLFPEILQLLLLLLQLPHDLCVCSFNGEISIVDYLMFIADNLSGMCLNIMKILLIQ